ncbi:GSCOCG00011397001-RA-CDS [Cotesia congregata]|nr:GSCOCG00011397001-RA-CDS [Cotesia congregata]
MKLKGIVSHVSIQPTKIQPIIVKFQNGKLQNNLVRKMKCGLFYDEREKKSLLGISNNHVVYKGHRPKNQLTYPMLAIHNKKTGKIKLIQAERWLVFPTTKKQLISNKNNEDNQNNLLNKEFGSKKVKRRTIQNSKMQVSIDAVQDQLAETVSQIEVDQDDLKVETIDDKFSSLPPCNRTASVVHEVYNLEDIIPAEKLMLMCENCDSLLQNEENRKATFFANSLRRIDNDAQKKKNLLS